MVTTLLTNNFSLIKGKFEFLNLKKFLNLKLNRQQLKKFYTYIFNIRWGRPSDLINYETFKKNYPKTSWNSHIKIRNFDIDDIDDWKIAVSVFKSLRNEK